MRILQHVVRLKEITSVKNTVFSSTRRLITFRQNMPPPDRWLDYSNVGKVIPGTNIVCFKVPLKNGLLRQVPPEMWFTPKNLIDNMEKECHKLVMVIDLTFTTKYYLKIGMKKGNLKKDLMKKSELEFTKNGVEHLKVFTEGHVIPSDDIVHRFFDAVETKTKATSEKVDVIGVHCTHGINRTGYMVCRYMIERLAFKPEEAIQAFNAARGHDIERENYLDDLRTKTFLEGYQNEGRHRLEQKKPNSRFGSHKRQDRKHRSERSVSQGKDNSYHDQHPSSRDTDLHSGGYHDSTRYEPSMEDRYPYGEYTYEIEEGQRDMESELDYRDRSNHSDHHYYHDKYRGRNDGDNDQHWRHRGGSQENSFWGHGYRGQGYDYRGQGHEHRGQGREHRGQGREHRGQGREHRGQGHEHRGQGQGYGGQGHDFRGQGQGYGGQHYINQGYREQGKGFERQGQNSRGQDYDRSWREDRRMSPEGDWKHSRSGQHNHQQYNSYNSREYKSSNRRQSHEKSDIPQSHERSNRLQSDKYGQREQTRDVKRRNSQQDRHTDHPDTATPQNSGHNSEL
ncbi:filaggrin-2-like [Pecten maximus]|uniref:filaggrin-2-like n=1 Tax=Pecten maximus TaxID=6579 RepID=UPI0014589E80|nr:filaggrin-2-like [Pecten maximus]